MRLLHAAPPTVVCVLLAAGCAGRTPTGGWQRVGGPLQNVSGMALVVAAPEMRVKAGHDTWHFLVVHDNKTPGEPRLGRVVVRGDGSPRPVSYRPLEWPRGAEPPADLEAIDTLPVGSPGGPDVPATRPVFGRRSFLAMTSTGRLLHLRTSGRDVEVLHESVLPGLKKLPNLEGFAIQSLAGETIAVWAERGNGDEPAVLYWGTYDAVTDVVSLAGQADLRVPFPASPTTRHVSDLRIDRDGVVWSTAASDPGDLGPYQSAFYQLGTIRVSDGKMGFEQNADLAPRWKTNRKVEALELLPGGEGLVYFGADDELAGGWVYVGRRGTHGK